MSHRKGLSRAAQERRIAHQILDGITTTKVNAGDSLPFALFSAKAEARGESVRWHCAYDETERITSVFVYSATDADDNSVSDRRTSIVPSLARAREMRDQLLADGWIPIELPEVTFNFPGMGARTLNGKEKKKMEKTIEKGLRANPFRDVAKKG